MVIDTIMMIYCIESIYIYIYDINIYICIYNLIYDTIIYVYYMYTIIIMYNHMRMDNMISSTYHNIQQDTM